MSKAAPEAIPRGRRRGFDRQDAIDTAVDVFWENGYESTSVTQLCAAIGINPPSLYAAFGSKAGLFLDVVDHYERTHWDPVWDAFERESLARVAVRRLLDDTIEVFTAQEKHRGCLVTLSTVNLADRESEVGDALTAIGDDGIRRTKAKLDFGVRDGQIPPGTDTLALAQAVAMMIDGLALRAHWGVPADNLRRLAAAVLEMIPEGGGRRAPAR